MRRLQRLGALMAVMAAVLAVAACGDDGGNGGKEPGELSGGILATFTAAGEEFKVWVTNPQTIDDILALRDGTSDATIPNGAIKEGPGVAGHNAPWSWHLDPQDIEMAEMTMELCDGAPGFVEEEVDYFIGTVKRYCPWDATLVDVEDYRDQGS